MRLAFARVLLGAALAGCSTTNTSYNNLQFNGDTVPFPDNYREDARRAVAGRPVETALQISRPEQMVGVGVFDPQRWYVCIRGLSPAGAMPKKSYRLDKLLMPEPANPVFEAIIVFSRYGAGRPKYTFDAPICRDLVYEPLPEAG
jgi:hypothetical protein